jgi:hypothetical protein
MENLRAPPLPSRPSGDGFERRNALTALSEDQVSDLGSHNSSLVDVSGASVQASPSAESAPIMAMNLPPPPSEIADDYGSAGVFKKQVDLTDATSGTRSSGMSSPIPLETRTSGETEDSRRERSDTLTKPSIGSRKSRDAPRPLSEEETMVAVELLFAVVNELYTLSSAWNIRKTLLNAAKSYLLRPGNPSLEAIRVLLQDTVIEANTSDSGIATHLLKMRENSLPTEEELAKWPPPLDEEERDQLRTKAKKLLVERGMPQALTSVMGSAASGEALGRLFDALQVEHVSRGLMFALLVQGIRMVTH